VRAFFALNFDADVRSRIARSAQPLYDAAPHVAWVRSELLHLTLKFLGEVPAESVDALCRLGEAAARAHSPRAVALAGFGAFPNLHHPRVVWMGMGDADVLALLADHLDRGSAPLGVPRDERPFRPHVTIGRIKGALAAPETAALAREAERASEPFTAWVGTIDLMRSTLSAGGPRYEVVATFPLGGS
jgi:2'-5' RNA ligase